MRVIPLASGSKGNCFYLEGDDGALLLDAGLSARELFRRLDAAGGRRDLVGAILVTHEHIDHIRGVDVVARKLDIPVFGTEGTLDEFSRTKKSGKPVRVKRCIPNLSYSAGGFTVTAFPTSHDAREPCGFFIEEHDTRIGCCTDTGIITEAMMQYLRRCDGLILESNHCPEMLDCGPYPPFLKKRIRSQRGHLSNADAAACLCSLAPDLAFASLSHLSEVNNTPEKALQSAREGVGLYGNEIVIGVALQNPGGGEHPFLQLRV